MNIVITLIVLSSMEWWKTDYREANLINDTRLIPNIAIEIPDHNFTFNANTRYGCFVNYMNTPRLSSVLHEVSDEGSGISGKVGYWDEWMNDFVNTVCIPNEQYTRIELPYLMLFHEDHTYELVNEYGEKFFEPSAQKDGAWGWTF